MTKGEVLANLIRAVLFYLLPLVTLILTGLGLYKSFDRFKGEWRFAWSYELRLGLTLILLQLLWWGFVWYMLLPDKKPLQ